MRKSCEFSSLANSGDDIEGKEAVVKFESTQEPIVGVQIRWLIRRDMTDVLQIEAGSFENAWTEEDFLCCLRQRNSRMLK